MMQLALDHIELEITDDGMLLTKNAINEDGDFIKEEFALDAQQSQELLIGLNMLHGLIHQLEATRQMNMQAGVPGPSFPWQMGN